MAVLLVLCVLIIILEKKKWHRFSSPASLLSMGYASASLLSIIGAHFFDFYLISKLTSFLLSLSLFLFWLPSRFFKSTSTDQTSSIDIDKLNGVEIIFFVVILFLIISCIVISYGFDIGNEAWEETYSNGIIAHLINLLNVFLVYCLCKKKKTTVAIFVILVSSFLIFASGVKYHILFPLICYFIYFIHKDIHRKKLFISSSLICLFIFIVFYANYYFGFMKRGGDMNNFTTFIVVHIIKYISGGFIVLSEILKNNADAISFFNSTASISHTIPVSTIGEESNVCGLFGHYLLQYGYVWAYSGMTLLGLFSYFVYSKIINSNNIFYFISYCYFIGVPILLGFFASYYHLLNIWEWSTISLFFSMIFGQLKVKKYSHY
jgi:oligosaccharide repeat unit polymerase